MTMHESKLGGVSEDWSVILQSVSPKQKKEVVKRVVEIFELDKKDAEQALSSMPLILLDNLSFGLAARVKNYFQKLGAVVETTNHDMIKKNCFQIVWPEVPDLGIFLKDDVEGVMAKGQQSPPAPVQAESRPNLPPLSQPFFAPTPASEEPKPVPSAGKPLDPGTAEKKDLREGASESESDWDKRARELSERLQTVQGEKPKLPSELSNEKEKMKNELLDRFKGPAPKPAGEDILKLKADLARETETSQRLQEKVDDMKAQAERLQNRVRDLEIADAQKTAALEQAAGEKGSAQPSPEAEGKVAELEKDLAAKEEEIAMLQARIQEMILRVKTADQENAERLRSQEVSKADIAGREKELAAQCETLEASLREKDRDLETLQNEMEQIRSRENGMNEKLLSLEAVVAEKENLLKGAEGELSETRDRERGFASKISELEAQITGKEKLLEEIHQQVAGLQAQTGEMSAKTADLEARLSAKDQAQDELRKQVAELQGREADLSSRLSAADRVLLEKEATLKIRDGALAELEKKVTEFVAKIQETEIIRQEHAVLSQERATIRDEYEARLTDQEIRVAKIEEEHRRYRSRVDRRNAAATRELGEWLRNMDILRQGLQKLIVFLGNQAAEPDLDKKNSPRALFNRSVNQNNDSPSA